ncbi:MAG: alpha/beta hydrolase fold domain-containing protein [Trebonia sp.]
MARVNLRLRVWGWVTRRQVSVATMSEAEIIALQSRGIPANAVTNWLFGTAPPGIEATDRLVPGPGGEIPVRVYRPAGAGEPAGRPLVVYFHGGGYVFGTLDLGNWMCGTVAARVGAVVVSVGYRLAPAHRFPAAVEDCYAALAWAADSAAELGATGPIGVMGESAGGTLAAVTCLLARERGGPAIGHQALVYPAADMTDGTEPSTVDPNAPFLSATEIAAYKRLYLGPDGDPAHPWASPLLAADHTGLPPALIQVGEHDPLRESGKRYAAALRAAGVPVRFTEYAGMPHGFVNFPGLSRAADQAMVEVCAEQSAALAPLADSTGS